MKDTNQLKEKKQEEL